MCAVSAITDHYKDKWSFPIDDSIRISKEQWLEYLELKRKMTEYDIRTKQHDCSKPDILDWEAKIIEVLKKQKVI